MRFRRRGTNPWQVRNFYQGALSGNVAAGGTTATDLSIFIAQTYLGNTTAAKAGKSYTLAFKSWTSDGIVTSAAAGTNIFEIRECIYLADINTVGASIYSGTVFLQQNEMAAVDARTLPQRIIFRRTVNPFPVFGSQVAGAINWVPRAPRVKVIVKETQGLFWHLEFNNSNGGNTQSATMTALAAIAVKLNP